MPKKKVTMDFDSIGKEHGKPDIERLGIFIEPPYLNGKGYVSPFGKPKYFKGRNMLPEGRKSKCGTQHGYFDEEFKRLFEGEPWQKKSRDRKGKGRAGIPFMPTGPSKWRSTPGDYYGCFSGVIEHFSNVRRKVQKSKLRPPANFLSNPCKKGGYGYVDICLSKYPAHLPDPYKPKVKDKGKKDKDRDKPAMITCHHPRPYFDPNPYSGDITGKPGPTYIRPKEKRADYTGLTFIPNGPAKWPGGSHAGCFTPFPAWEPGKPRKEKSTRRRRGEGDFYPQSMALKSMNTVSVLSNYVDFKMNVKNCDSYGPNYTQYLLDGTQV